MSYAHSIYMLALFFLAQYCLYLELHVEDDDAIVFLVLLTSKRLHPALVRCREGMEKAIDFFKV